MFVAMVMHMKKKNALILGIPLATTIVSGVIYLMVVTLPLRSQFAASLDSLYLVHIYNI